MKNIYERMRALERNFDKAMEYNSWNPLAVIYAESVINDEYKIYYFSQGMKSPSAHISGNWNDIELFCSEHQDITITLDFSHCLEWALVNQIIENQELSETRKSNFTQAFIEANPQCEMLLNPENGELYQFIKATPMIMYKK